MLNFRYPAAIVSYRVSQCGNERVAKMSEAGANEWGRPATMQSALFNYHQLLLK